ncbi:MAG: efflux RND transporter permease subunit [Candidatus Geothermincolia bacterium]
MDASEREGEQAIGFFARLCRDHGRAVVVVCLLLTLPVAAGMFFIEIKAGQKDLIPSRLETARTLAEVNELFGGTTNEYPMVESDALLAYPMIKKFLLFEDALADAVGEGDYVYVEHYLAAYGLNVLDQARQRAIAAGLPEGAVGFVLPNVATVLGFGEGTMQADPNNPEALLPFERIIEDGVRLYLANPVAHKWTVEKEGSALLSRDSRYAKILIKVNPDFDSAQSKDFAARFEDFFHSYFEQGEEPANVYIAGDPSIDKDLEDYVVSSTWLMAVIALAMLMALLYLTFQRITDIFLPLAVIVITAAWIYGFMGWFGLPFTVVSALIGPLVLGISLGNMVHMMGRFYEESSLGKKPHDAAYTGVLTVGVAIFLACITTIFGFASFGFSDLDILREFGYMAAVGIGLCFVFSVSFLPALMSLRERRRSLKGAGRPPRGAAIFAADANTFIDRFLRRVSSISQKRPRLVLAIYLLVVVLSALGTYRLTTTPDLRALAPQDIPSLQAQYLQESIFGGQQQDVLLLTGVVLQPEAQAAMLAFQDRLAETPYFNREGTSSVVELIGDFRTQMGNPVALPASKAEAEDDLRAIGALFGEQEGKLISEDHQAALISIFSQAAASNPDMVNKNRALFDAAQAAFGDLEGIEFKLGGITPLTAEMLGNLVPTQIETSLLALILSGLVLILIFRSFTYGLATLSVLIAGISVELGFLSLMGWKLDMMTVLIVSMIIGMGIDYGIHVTHRFLEEYEPDGVSVADALGITVTRMGKTLVASTISMAGAFLVIAYSKMQPIRRFGFITALSLAVSLLASLLVLPSIITLMARRRERKAVVR